MEREQKTNIDQLDKQKQVLSLKITSAERVFDYIERKNFKTKPTIYNPEGRNPRLLTLDLTETNPFDALQLADNLTRVGSIRERLRNTVLPEYRSEMLDLSIQIATKKLDIFSTYRDRLTRLVESKALQAMTDLQWVDTMIERHRRIIDELKQQVNVGNLPFDQRIHLEENLAKIRRDYHRGLITEQELKEDYHTAIKEATLASAAERGTIVFTPPSTDTPIADVEPSAEKELPVIGIDSKNRTIEVFGKTKIVREQILWECFKYILQNGSRGISTSELTEFARQAGDTRMYPARDIVQAFRLRFEADPRKNELLSRSGIPSSATYSLNARVEFIGEVPQDVSPPDSKVEDDIVFVSKEEYLKRGIYEIDLPNGQKFITQSLNEKLVVECWVRASEQQPISTDDILIEVFAEEINRGVEIDILKKRLYNYSFMARKKLAKLDLEVVNMTTAIERMGHQVAKYYLRDIPKREKFGEDESEVLSSNLVLPNGQEMTSKELTPKAEKCLEELLHGNSEGGRTAEALAEYIYRDEVKAGVNIKTLVVRVMYLIKDLRERLELKDCTIINERPKGSGSRNQPGRYFVMSLDRSLPPPEGSPTLDPSWAPFIGDIDETEEPGVGKTAEFVSPINTQESAVIEIPYVPTEEEKRSEAETKVLDTVISYLSSHTRLYFENLQKELVLVSLPDRIREQGGRSQFKIYQAEELNRIFDSALTKIREEAAIVSMRELWQNEDQQLWEKVQSLMRKLSSGDTAAFQREIHRLIIRAERDFYRLHKPKNGDQKVYWLDI